jgi:hypothetical protein
MKLFNFGLGQLVVVPIGGCPRAVPSCPGKAISNFLLDNPSLRVAMPPQESMAEAIMTARMDFQLTMFQMRELTKLLRKKPT